MCYEKINDPKQAIEAYQKALLIKSNFTDAQTALAKLGGKPLDEDIKDASLARANSLVMQKKYDEAIVEYSNYLKKEPLNFQAQINMGFCYEQKNDPERARQHYQNALKMNATSTNASEGLARVEKMLKNRQAETLKMQIDDDVNFERYAVAQTRLQQYLQLIPNDRWAVDKVQVVEAAIEKQKKTTISLDLTENIIKSDSTPKTASVLPDTADTEIGPTENQTGNIKPWWLFILIGVVVLAAVIVLFSRKKKTAPVLSAKSHEITNISVHKFLSECHSTKRTGIVSVETRNGAGAGKDIEGKIYLKNGNIVKANCGKSESVEALYRLLETNLPDNLTFQETSFSNESNIYQATMPLLVQWQIKQENK